MLGYLKMATLIGQGTLVTPNGDKYVGGWKDGKGHGRATLTSINGEKSIVKLKNEKR